MEADELINSVWQTVGSLMERWGGSFRYWLWEISYLNVQMLLASIPDVGYDAPPGDVPNVDKGNQALTDFLAAVD